ncbi:carboxymuconolactone decarboxylase family protein [Microbispora sp. NEAU-D428]|uniref:carboxymuconolactone decarboxylase family protein n=1 Tax=Microbispora sitophila TaxID=2771537 RepID=UPI0018666E8B|nr:carboxymuconolactone decarboxylase family protein [Microbispora sitophila]MBE3012523.1 carboxymuconolactone decarboxylase family protein [Microbispora sitophila]
MIERINVRELAPEAYQAMLGVERFLHECGVPHATLELVKIRASQINGCAFCLDMHCRDAKKAGESDERLWSVAAWREAPYYTDAERAALALSEAATRLADRPDPVPDEIWADAAEHYTQEQLAALVVAIAQINAWNRICVVSRKVPGSL